MSGMVYTNRCDNSWVTWGDKLKLQTRLFIFTAGRIIYLLFETSFLMSEMVYTNRCDNKWGTWGDKLNLQTPIVNDTPAISHPRSYLDVV